MKRRFIRLKLICGSIIFSLLCSTLSWSMQEEPKSKKGQPQLQTRVLFTPQKQEAEEYGGFSFGKKDVIEKVLVRPCISLGQSCAQETANMISNADQFVVMFMYRINSPIVIDALANKFLTPQFFNPNTKLPVVVFLDYDQSTGGSSYHNYIDNLIKNVPTSLVKLGSAAFHHKVVICKSQGSQAVCKIGSANDTYEAENVHSEDMVIIQSNELAGILLREFYSLLRMKVSTKTQTVKVYHEHQYLKEKSNIDQLLSMQEMLDVNDVLDLKESGGIAYEADICALAISTGFAKGDGKQKCMNVLKRVIKKNHLGMLLFENYLTSPDVLKSLAESNTLQLIVIDDDKNNRQAVKDFPPKDHQKLLIFSPYTQGKFHHKLVIHYDDGKIPTLYTGSFHPSVSAVDNNSEIIIGIKSWRVTQEYLSSILWQSGLGTQVEVWRFLLSLPPNLKIFYQKPELLEVAKKIQGRTERQIDGYPNRFVRIFDCLPPVEEKAQQEFQSEFEEESKEFFKLEYNAKLLQIQAWEERLVTKIFKPCYLDNFEVSINAIRQKLDLEKFIAIRKPWLAFLENVAATMQEMNEKAKLTKTQKKLDRLKHQSKRKEEAHVNIIKEKPISQEINEVERIYTTLNDANKYVSEFGELVNLLKVLTKITASSDESESSSNSKDTY